MIAKVNGSTAGESPEMPTVEVSGVKHGILSEESKRLYLADIAWSEGSVGMG